MKEEFLQIMKLIEASENILIVSHIDADGDAFGSMLGLKIALQHSGHPADVFSLSYLPAYLNFLPAGGQIKKDISDSQYDFVIGLDYGDLKHLETVAAGMKFPLPTVTFDHHPYSNQTGDFKIIDSSFSAACEIIYEFLMTNNLLISKDIATCLLTGIVTDTWCFRHPNTTPRTLDIAGNLLSKGASLNKIIKLTNQNDIGIKTKIWGRALAKTNFDQNIGLAFCFINYNDMIECQANSDNLSGLASVLCAIPDANFSLVLSEITPGRFHGSFRSLPNRGFDVEKLAGHFGGGGHKLSAGFKTDLKPPEILKKIKRLIREERFANV